MPLALSILRGLETMNLYKKTQFDQTSNLCATMLRMHDVASDFDPRCG